MYPFENDVNKMNPMICDNLYLMT